MISDKILLTCKELLKRSSHQRYKFGCILVKKNRIISTGYNQLKTDPKSPHEYKMLHAEIHCLLRAPKNRIMGSPLFIYMEKPNGKPGMSKPCPCCLEMLKNKGVKDITYVTTSGIFEQILL